MSTLRAMPGGWASYRTLPRGAAGRCLCRWCAIEVPKGRRTFCSDDCVHEWRLRSNLTLIYNAGGACPYCGRPADGNGPQRLGIHMAKGHPGEPTRLAASFVRAREMGDPHGVVAKVLALVGPDGQYIPPAPARRKR